MFEITDGNLVGIEWIFHIRKFRKLKTQNKWKTRRLDFVHPLVFITFSFYEKIQIEFFGQCGSPKHFILLAGFKNPDRFTVSVDGLQCQIGFFLCGFLIPVGIEKCLS